MARFVLVQPSTGRVLQIAPEQFAVHPELVWVDVSELAADDSWFLDCDYVDGAFIHKELPEPIEPPPPPPPDANERLDRAMAAAYEALPERPADTRRRMTEEQLQDYVYEVSDALRALILGLRNIQPRSDDA